MLVDVVAPEVVEVSVDVVPGAVTEVRVDVVGDRVVEMPVDVVPRAVVVPVDLVPGANGDFVEVGGDFVALWGRRFDLGVVDRVKGCAFAGRPALLNDAERGMAVRAPLVRRL